MSHVYEDVFFDYIEAGARRSARRFVSLLTPWLAPSSVLDLGAGRGVWLDEWRRGGATDVLGIDGAYVDPGQLAISRDCFRAADLTRPLEIGRRFDLAQSLEVGEHLPRAAAETLVDSLTAASDRVLFSAATVGQGGEFHVNEQPLSFWQDLFAERGYCAIDCLRPALKTDRDVEPWYRFNAVLYVNAEGLGSLPDEVTRHVLSEGEAIADGGNFPWRLRRAIVSRLPQSASTNIARMRARIIAARARRGATVRLQA